MEDKVFRTSDRREGFPALAHTIYLDPAAGTLGPAKGVDGAAEAPLPDADVECQACPPGTAP